MYNRSDLYVFKNLNSLRMGPEVICCDFVGPHRVSPVLRFSVYYCPIQSVIIMTESPPIKHSPEIAELRAFFPFTPLCASPRPHNGFHQKHFAIQSRACRRRYVIRKPLANGSATGGGGGGGVGVCSNRVQTPAPPCFRVSGVRAHPVLHTVGHDGYH